MDLGRLAAFVFAGGLTLACDGRRRAARSLPRRRP